MLRRRRNPAGAG